MTYLTQRARKISDLNSPLADLQTSIHNLHSDYRCRLLLIARANRCLQIGEWRIQIAGLAVEPSMLTPGARWGGTTIMSEDRVEIDIDAPRLLSAVSNVYGNWKCGFGENE